MKRLFIASSVEGLDFAYAIQENLDYMSEVTVWDQDIFQPSRYTLEDLEEALERFDYGVFVLTPDDKARMRKDDMRIARDNVLFELGLFIGKLGRENCFFVAPRDLEEFHLPSDLIGLAPLTYSSKRDDGNLKAILGPACNKIRKRITELDTNLASARAKFDILNHRYPSKRTLRYLDTACIFRDRNGFDSCVSYQALFANAQHIRGLGISCNAILMNWGLRNLEHIVIEKNCRIQLLMLEPEGNFIRQREEEERQTPGTIVDVTKSNLALAKRFWEALPIKKRELFEVRNYDRPVSLNMYIIDRSFVVIQHYMPDTRGQETPVFVIRHDELESGLFDAYEQLFETLWGTSSDG